MNCAKVRCCVGSPLMVVTKWKTSLVPKTLSVVSRLQWRRPQGFRQMGPGWVHLSYLEIAQIHSLKPDEGRFKSESGGLAVQLEVQVPRPSKLSKPCLQQHLEPQAKPRGPCSPRVPRGLRCPELL